MRVVFGCEEAALLDQCVIEAREGIAQLGEALAYLHAQACQDGMGESGDGQQTEQKFRRAEAWCRQADKTIIKIGALFEEEMSGLRERQQALLETWLAERQATPDSSYELVHT
jgi:hypothetical protein